MIRINLLGVPKSKKGKRTAAAAAAMAAPAPSALTLVLVVLLITVAANGFYWWWITSQKSALAERLQAAERKRVQLMDVKLRFDERQKQKDAYQKRLDVINQLRTGQTKPVEMLNVMGDTVNATEAVWLSWVREEGNNVELEGVALSTTAVANLMENIRRSGYFKTVEIKESYQDEKSKELPSFIFQLICEKKKA